MLVSLVGELQTAPWDPILLGCPSVYPDQFLQETLSLLDIVNDFSHECELRCLSFPKVSWLA